MSRYCEREDCAADSRQPELDVEFVYLLGVCGENIGGHSSELSCSAPLSCTSLGNLERRHIDFATENR